MRRIDATTIIEGVLATVGAITIIYLIYKIFGHDMIGLK